MARISDVAQPVQLTLPGLVRPPVPVQPQFVDVERQFKHLTDTQLAQIGLTREQLEGTGLTPERTAALEAVVHLKARVQQIGGQDIFFSLFGTDPGFSALFGYDPGSGKPHFSESTLRSFFKRNWVSKLQEPCGPGTENHQSLLKRVPGQVNALRLGAILALLHPHMPTDLRVGLTAAEIEPLKAVVAFQMPRMATMPSHESAPTLPATDPMLR